jgi:site-specific DNA-cytosine methylase
MFCHTKDVSSQNNSAPEFSNCIAEGTGRTGTTWRGCADYERAHDPDVSVYENVLNITKTNAGDANNLETCQQHLSQKRRSSIALEMNPRDFLIPERRFRMRLVASKWLRCLRSWTK